jgi:trigger factor
MNTLKIESQPRDDQQVKLIVDVDPEELDKYRHLAARKIAQQTRFPGFRPGKAPYDFVRRSIGDDAILKQAVQEMVDDLYPKILDESGIKPGGPGELEEIISYDPPKLSFIIPIEPEVVLGDYLSIRKEYTAPLISDEDVEKVVLNLQKRMGTAKPVERPAQDGDVAYINLKGNLSQTDQEDDRVFDETGIQILIGGGNFEGEEYPYPGFDRELIGLSAGEGKNLVHTYAPDAAEETLRGKEVQIQVNVESVKELDLPELSDEFSKNFGYQNVEEMRHSIRERLTQERNSSYDNDYDLELLDQLVSISTIKYPPQYLEKEIEDMVKSFEKNLERSKLDMATYLKTIKKSKEQFIKEDIEPVARKRIARAFMVEKLIEIEKVTLTQDELNKAVAQRIDQIEDHESNSKRKRKTLNRSNVGALAMSTANILLNQHAIELLRSIAKGTYSEFKPSETAENIEPQSEPNTAQESSESKNVNQTSE